MNDKKTYENYIREEVARQMKTFYEIYDLNSDAFKLKKNQNRIDFEFWLNSTGWRFDTDFEERLWMAWEAGQSIPKVCCGEYETCQSLCGPKADYLREKYKNCKWKNDRI